jgi:hypothetical protein
MAHDPQCLAVSLRMRTAEIVAQILLSITALLMPEYRDRSLTETCKPGDHCRVIAEAPVAT